MVQRLTKPTARVLAALLEAGPSGCYGLELMDNAKVGAGTIYPMLTRLEEAGWVESLWEDVDPTKAGRPARRYYTLTGLGHTEATAKLSARSGLPSRLSQA